ncbi:MULTISPECIES: DUF6265 family protein [unclassified Flavobacterium]|uniref:DUF6265 family protein n=1 Tax=unclassified Flavobacterium TaxID=196869 RepID=UPI000EB32CCA|nr:MULTISPECIES: DUF6265 family protein [unclassified Flavobacterium]RKS03178.1 hypothetical protein C8C84_2921 [Flavobacterium sp. 102]
MKTILSLLTLFTIFSFTPKGETPKLGFLHGTWKMEAKENYETWEMVNDHELKGSSYRIKGDKKITTENLSIKISGDKATYTAIVLDQNNGQPVDFVLNKEVKNKFSFENLTHDFPKKIQYTVVDDKTLFVEVLGDNDQGFSYKMLKQ